MSFGGKLKQKREEKGLTQDQLAELIVGTGNRQTVSGWERYKTFPKVDALLKLSVILGISLDELFSEEIQYYKKQYGKDEMECPEGMLVMLETFAQALEKNKKQVIGGNKNEK